MYKLDYRIEEIKYVRSMIEQDARTTFGGMIERLKSFEGNKISMLQHEMSEIQKDIDAINEIIQEFTLLTKPDVPQLQFMTKSATLRQNVDYLLNKPFKSEIDEVPYDMPRELQQLRAELEQNKKLDDLLKMKDQIIYDLSQKIKYSYKNAVADLDLAANNEIAHWAGLSDKFASELNDFQRI